MKEKYSVWQVTVPYHGFFDRELVLTTEILNKGNRWGHPFYKNYGFYDTLVGRYGIFISVCIFNFTKDIHSDTKHLILIICEPELSIWKRLLYVGLYRYYFLDDPCWHSFQSRTVCIHFFLFRVWSFDTAL